MCSRWSTGVGRKPESHSRDFFRRRSPAHEGPHFRSRSSFAEKPVETLACDDLGTPKGKRDHMRLIFEAQMIRSDDS